MTHRLVVQAEVELESLHLRWRMANSKFVSFGAKLVAIRKTVWNAVDQPGQLVVATDCKSAIARIGANTLRELSRSGLPLEGGTSRAWPLSWYGCQATQA